jgi:hypothetical protein
MLFSIDGAIVARVHGVGKISRCARNDILRALVIPNEVRDLAELNHHRQSSRLQWIGAGIDGREE